MSNTQRSESVELDSVWVQRLPYAAACRLQALVVGQVGDRVQVLMAQPDHLAHQRELEFLLQQPVWPLPLNVEQAQASIDQAYGVASGWVPTDRAASGASERQPAAHWAQALAQSHIADAAQLERDLHTDSPLVRLVNSLIMEAHDLGASDIHLEPDGVSGPVQVRLRLDGQLQPYLQLPGTLRNALVARIKVMCDLDIAQRRKPQDGKIRFAQFGPLAIELRVATMPTAQGQEDVVLRVLNSAKPMPLDQMAWQPDALLRLRGLLRQPHGLLLCAGPTGSGKTTTLHALLQVLNTPERKIWTAEDPIEITQPGLRQIQVNPLMGWSFADALRSLLRADPDVIMVGEVRDRVTADMAVEASLTGHLVLSTLHTNSAAETLVRLLDLGVDAFALSDSLLGVVAQRLVRRLCSHCRQDHSMTPDTLQALVAMFQADLPADHAWQQPAALIAHWTQQWGPLRHWQASGCTHCQGTGLQGRVALHEVMPCTPAMKALMQHKAASSALLQCATAQGMHTLRQDGVLKVLQGLTRLSEVQSATVG